MHLDVLLLLLLITFLQHSLALPIQFRRIIKKTFLKLIRFATVFLWPAREDELKQAEGVIPPASPIVVCRLVRRFVGWLVGSSFGRSNKNRNIASDIVILTAAPHKPKINYTFHLQPSTRGER